MEDIWIENIIVEEMINTRKRTQKWMYRIHIFLALE